MKAATCGRIVFGAAAVFFGAIALRWHDAATWQNTAHLWSLPFGAAIGALLMAAQLAGGIGIWYPRKARRAAIALGIVYVFFSLACVPDIVAAANTYDKYGGSFFLFLSLVWGALAVFTATEANAARAVVLSHVTRVGLGICAISFTLGQALQLRGTAQGVPSWIPFRPMFWAILTTIAFALAAVAILFNRQARLAMRLMALMVGLFGVLAWIPRVILLPGNHFMWSECAESFLVAGAAWVVAELGGASPRPGNRRAASS
jgi:hypothetical protein